MPPRHPSRPPFDASIFSVAEGDLPYDPLDEASILARARALTGRTVAEVARELASSPILDGANKGKGKIGDLVEAWFHLSPNQRAEADFPCGVELKVAPLRRTKKSLNSKERMVLGMISFHEIIKETWESASVRKKFERILFVVYVHDFDDPRNSVFEGAMLWTPPARDMPQIRVDWTKTRDTIRDKPPDALTESLGKIMGPCTKGGSSRDFASHPYAPGEVAMRRAFAFKSGYVWVQIQREMALREFVSGSSLLLADQVQLRIDDEQLFVDTGRTRLELVESALLSRLHDLKGLTIGDVCESRGISVRGSSKNLAASLLNSILGVDDYEAIEELAQVGVRVKTVHARTPGASLRGADLAPYEAMSFPAVDFDELLEEDWDEGTARFPEEIQRLLIIPTLSRERANPQADRVIGRAFFWSPTSEQMNIIENDWREIQELVANGGAAERIRVGSDGAPIRQRTAKRALNRATNDLPGEREDHILHMRPHARDADDKVDVPGGRVTRQSFWLNKGFIRRLLLANEAGTAKELGLTIE